MEVKVRGQFLENGSYHSSKTDSDVKYTVVLVGSTALEVRNVHQPVTVKRLDEIEMLVDMRAYGSQLTATYIAK